MLVSVLTLFFISQPVYFTIFIDDLSKIPSDIKSFFVPKNIAYSAGILSLSAVLFIADGEVRRFAKRIDVPDYIQDFTSFLGDGRFITTFGLSLYAISLISGEKRAKTAFLSAIESTGITAFFNEVVKFSTGRGRPYYTGNPYSFKFMGGFESDDRKSFFSSHTSGSFSYWSCLERFWDSPFSKTLYVIPTMVALSRIKTNAHWFSDTVAGAGIGYILGRHIAQRRIDEEKKLRGTPHPEEISPISSP